MVSVVGFGRPKFPGPEGAIPLKEEKPADPKSYPGETIDPGESGAHIKLIQKALGVPADGQYGPVTKKAIIAWQKANPKYGDADGVIGAKTWAALIK